MKKKNRSLWQPPLGDAQAEPPCENERLPEKLEEVDLLKLLLANREVDLYSSQLAFLQVQLASSQRALQELNEVMRVKYQLAEQDAIDTKTGKITHYPEGEQ